MKILERIKDWVSRSLPRRAIALAKLCGVCNFITKPWRASGPDYLSASPPRPLRTKPIPALCVIAARLYYRRLQRGRKWNETLSL